MKNTDINSLDIFKNINSLIEKTNFDQFLGANWYTEKSMHIANVATSSLLKGLISIKTYCAVVSILSPANSWSNNLWDAHFLVNRFFGIIKEGQSVWKYRTYQNNVDKAVNLLERIESGEEEDQVINDLLNNKTGLKTWNFYNNLYKPENSDFLTIDRHILKICGFNVKKITSKNYETIKEILTVYHRSSKFSALSLANFQAVLWCNYLNLQGKPF